MHAWSARNCWAHFAALAVAITGLVTLTLTLIGRVSSPWPLEWMEGGVLHHVLRIAQGKAIYGPPSSEFIPYLYPPLAYLPGALLAMLNETSLPAQRSVSLLGLALTLVAIHRIVWRRTHHPTAGLAATGIFALGYGYTGAFLDLLRVDSLFIALMVWAVERMDSGRTRTGLWLLALSGLAKQHGFVLLVAACIALAWRDRRATIAVITPPLAFSFLGLLVLSLATGGWFWTYVFELPAAHGMEPLLFVTFFVVDLALYLPVLSVGAFLVFKRGWRSFDPVLATLSAALLVSALGRAHPGGDDNVRLPAFALLCALALCPLLSSMLSSQTRVGLRVTLVALLLGQAAMLWQPPSLYQPSAQSSLQFTQLQTTMSHCASQAAPSGQGAVALDYPLLTTTPFLHTMALSDLALGHGLKRLNAMARASLLDRLSSPKAPRALAIGSSFPELDRVVASHYEPCESMAAPRMASGYQPHTQRIYRLRQAPITK